ncbi:polyhydroxyalkanoate synthesis regulator DNA-binding domain-containing protein [Legionella sp. CNM-4043-24]|uniref:polyhydroxyalkanoate synthesis regulator DNA-binding domain-containing protein n=1 Tax=Legionella sp. CNM-4043-24 TaxID=3421646 RepID=UPI00403ABCBE
MTRLIKKYKNRRLYDTKTSQYITVEELQRYVVEGIPFRVEDSKEGQDLTNATLLQIIVEMESGSSKFLSSDMLRQLIILAHHPMNQAFKEMLEKVFAATVNPGLTNPFAGDTDEYRQVTDRWQQQVQDMLSQWQGLFKK